MSRRSPISNAEYTTYEFTASSEIDYNYDPSGSTTSTFDPYTDTYNSPPASPLREDDWRERYTRADSRRSPSPPARPPIPTSPSPEYISESQKPSSRLTVPAEARKLLILDLNGTLVYRTPHVRREFRPHRRHARAAQHYQDQYHASSNYQSYSHYDSRPYDPLYSAYAPPSHLLRPSSPTPNSISDPGDPYADHTAPRPLRTVHPRPYMRAFREYLFHPSTRGWLDTMVWSSAQPHSVADMVDKCFGSQQEELLAVWARDTLGLEEKDYHRKTQTTKDLSKPWSKLSINPSSSSSSDPDTPQAHSAHTTLLMDDSPRKAYLQPYNHLCIREYTGALRQIDLQSRQREQRALSQPQPQADTETPREATETSPFSEPSTSTLDHTSPSEPLSPTLSPSKKRKRPKKKHSEHEHEPAELEDDLHLGLGGYDPTLLAVVGVLERIKWEGNVAGWVRSGGLAKSYLEDREEYGVGVGVGEKEKGKGKQEKEKEGQEGVGEGEGDLGEGEGEAEKSTSSISTDASAPQDSKRRRVSDEHSSPPLTNGDPASSSSLSASSPSLATATPAYSIPAAALETIGDTGQWFEDKTVLRYWVRRGVKALEGLGIEVDSGIVV